jgi:hypothetical protein
MAEKHVLGAPVVVPDITDYEVITLTLQRVGSIVYIEVRANTGEITRKMYDGATAATMIQQLNKANLSVKSLERRILERLAADGVLAAGTISGTPD